MKGVTGVIVAVLLLLIAIAMIGMVFTFFTGLTTSATREAEKTITQVQKESATRASIISPISGKITVQNTGTTSFKKEEILLLENDALKIEGQDECELTGVWGGNAEDIVPTNRLMISKCKCELDSTIKILYRGNVLDSRPCVIA